MAERLFTDLTATLLRQGHGVRFRAEGGSMHPTIRDGEVIAVEFVEPRDVKRGDILLYRSAKRVIAHRVVAILNPRPSILNPPSLRRPRLSSIFKPQSSLVSPQSSVLRTQDSSLMTSFILRGDASSSRDAPVESGQVLGKVVSVERNGRRISLHGTNATFLRSARRYAFQLARLSGISGVCRPIRRVLELCCARLERRPRSPRHA